MIIKFQKKLFIKEIIKKINLKAKYYGNPKKTVLNACSEKYSNSDSLTFSENKKNFSSKKNNRIVILKKKNFSLKNQLITNDPRLYFIKILNIYFEEEIKKNTFPTINQKEFFLKKAKLQKNYISNDVFIGENVLIGKNCYIGRNVVIYPRTKIGNNVNILDNSVLGSHGMGYHKSLLMPHMGSLIVKNNVNIGSNCTLVRGTLDNTFIADDVKIANNVNIGHNVKIKSATLISSSVCVSGGVKIQSNCELGAGVLIKNNLNIGKNCKIGIGTVVVKDTKTNSMIFGNPGKRINFLNKIL